MNPWFNGFKGEIIKVNDQSYMSKGKYEITSPTSIRITELPIGKWTDDYKKFLDTLLPEEKKKKSKENEEHSKKKVKKRIIDYINNSSDTEVDFTIIVPIGFIHGLQWSEKDNVDGIEEYFKLYTTKGLSLSNIHLYNNGKITKFKNINDIFEAFYIVRYDLYLKRKDYILKQLFNTMEILSSKIRFIHDVIDEKIVIYKRKKEDIIQSLLNNQYKQMKDKIIIEKEEIEPNGYDYLVKMSLYSFTEEEISKLESEYDKIQTEYNTLNEQTIEDLWLKECDLFMKQYRKFKLKV